MSVAGTYDTVVKSPMGDQKGTFTVVPGDDGNSFTGSMAGGMGSMDVVDGTVDGNTLSCVIRDVIRELVRVARPDGRVVVSIPNEARIDRAKRMLRRVGPCP